MWPAAVVLIHRFHIGPDLWARCSAGLLELYRSWSREEAFRQFAPKRSEVVLKSAASVPNCELSSIRVL